MRAIKPMTLVLNGYNLVSLIVFTLSVTLEIKLVICFVQL